MEYARQAKNVLKVITLEMKTPDFKFIDFANASANEETPCNEHALPMELNEYADANPMNANNTHEGIKAFFESLNKAIPLGKLKTPAPKIVLAKFRIDGPISDVPPAAETLGTAAVTLYLLSISDFKFAFKGFTL